MIWPPFLFVRSLNHVVELLGVMFASESGHEVTGRRVDHAHLEENLVPGSRSAFGNRNASEPQCLRLRAFTRANRSGGPRVCP